MSSIKVNGETTQHDRPFLACNIASPQDPYAVSKYEAEQALFKLSQETGMEVVCIRPPLVYGPGVKANFLAMIYFINLGLPLPFGSICNNRSLIGLDNLVDLVCTCLRHPAAAGQVFLASDGEDLTTPDMLQRLGHAMQRPVRLFPFPVKGLLWIARILGQGDRISRLSDSLAVNIKHTCDTLEWTPPVKVDEGFRRTVAPLLKAAKQE
jgi:nucleoside-diphosphate-sugar epimerase